jgi:hypothetical protein
LDIQAIVSQLRDEINRIDAALAALDGTGTTAIKQPTTNGRRRGRRRLSAAAKKRISEAAKARWAKAKKAGRNRL